MAKGFEVGDSVSWEWADDHIRGKVVKVHRKQVTFMGRDYHGSDDDPMYEVESDKTKHHAVHKKDALTRI